MRRHSVLLVLALLVASCSGGDATEETDLSWTAAPMTTTTAAPTTITTAAPTTITTAAPTTTTTVAAATTTTEADGDAPADGSTVLHLGDCFIEIPVSGEDVPDYEVVPCDTPHLGEVVGTGTACPPSIGAAEFMALGSDYVGVAEDEFFDWMEIQQITGMSLFRVGDDGRFLGTACYLRAEEGDLNQSYRATSG